MNIGCGGKVFILLQPISARENYLGLKEMYRDLLASCKGFFFQQIPDHNNERALANWIAADAGGVMHSGLSDVDKYALTRDNCLPRICEIPQKDSSWLVSPVKPIVHLLIIGGGIDARPLAAMASQLGWKVSVCDPRPANARREHFCKNVQILTCDIKALAVDTSLADCQAAVVMTHNLTMDANAIAVLQNFPIQYMALLGPQARKKKVLHIAGLDESPPRILVRGPAGLDLGAELPEGVALSILSECYAVLHRANGRSLSDSALLNDAVKQKG